MYFIKGLLLLFFVLLTSLCWSQSDTLLLGTVEISSNSLYKKSAGIHVLSPDTLLTRKYESGNISALLSDLGLFVKNNGPNALNTISIRGRGTNHTAVLWNGFNINSPTLGTIDLNSIPINALQSVDVYLSGSSPYTGSTALGGLIDIKNKYVLNDGIRFEAMYGYNSASNHFTKIEYVVSKKDISLSGSFSNTNNSNRYRFKNVAKRTEPIERITHAAYDNSSIIQNAFYAINTKHSLEAGIWHQNSSKQIPPPMTSFISNAIQRDSLIRTFMRHRYVGNKFEWQTGVAIFDEYQQYQDESKEINSKYNYKTLEVNSSIKKWLSNRFVIEGGLVFQKQAAKSESFDKSKMDINTGIVVSSKFLMNPRVVLSSSLRQDFLNNKASPFAPMAGIEYQWNEQLILSGNLGFHFKNATMNDRYWLPGGNEDLLSEESFNQEVKLSYQKQRSVKYGGTIAFHHAIIDNWIEWQPGPKQYYEAFNLKKVQTYGSDVGVYAMFKISSVHVQTKIRYSILSSTSKESYYTNIDQSIGNQLIYTPKHFLFSELLLTYRNFLCSVSNSFTGIQNVTVDESFQIDSYYILNSYVEYVHTFNRLKVYSGIHLNNIGNKSYQIIAWQAMPLFNYTINLKLTYSLNNL
ncbi:MAG TPA: TonB-dependent receptor plug domain-containing protein [Bacteroidia bacterium]|nr:TonB-dependent receptor plug domain-containing protein [Bacteroidia bacterium]HNT79256.1 TonB-dependent receptor plug domain-containing protein [Bacteroidia bacterium]